MLMNKKLRMKPKWLVLKDGEQFVRAYLQQQTMFILLMLGSIGIFLTAAAQTIAGAPDTVKASIPVVATSIMSLATMFAAKKVYVTSTRLVVGKHAKDSLAIPLGEITALEAKGNLAGKVFIHHSGDQPVVISTFYPIRIAQEIQAVCAASQS